MKLIINCLMLISLSTYGSSNFETITSVEKSSMEPNMVVIGTEGGDQVMVNDKGNMALLLKKYLSANFPNQEVKIKTGASKNKEEGFIDLGSIELQVSDTRDSRGYFYIKDIPSQIGLWLLNSTNQALFNAYARLRVLPEFDSDTKCANQYDSDFQLLNDFISTNEQ